MTESRPPAVPTTGTIGYRRIRRSPESRGPAVTESRPPAVPTTGTIEYRAHPIVSRVPVSRSYRSQPCASTQLAPASGAPAATTSATYRQRKSGINGQGESGLTES